MTVTYPPQWYIGYGCETLNCLTFPCTTVAVGWLAGLQFPPQLGTLNSML